MSGWTSDVWISLVLATIFLAGGSLVLAFHSRLDRRIERKLREREERIAAGAPVPELAYDPTGAPSSTGAGVALAGVGLFFFLIFLVETL
jgi:hypothetical protein